MKKVLLFVTLLIGSVSFGQTIMVNGTPMLVSDDISFPFWLESGSSIDIGENVMSISIIEFALIPNSNHYDLEFIQTKIISDQEIVPNNITWKVESILLDNSEQSNTDLHTYNYRGFMLGEGIHSPDTLKYWRVDAINLKNDPATYTILGNLNGCYFQTGTSYPYTYCSYFNSESSSNILKLGEMNVTVSPSSEGGQVNVSSYPQGNICGDNPCPSTYELTYSFTNSVFEKINFPIFISSSESIEISSTDILLSVVEFTIQ